MLRYCSGSMSRARSSTFSQVREDRILVAQVRNVARYLTEKLNLDSFVCDKGSAVIQGYREVV